ncbi:hypothetical protein [Flavobacterium selenitireducens]|uniref:hypothetical protein n=1 Tax=Flavobacterium selenitireducens TaxID=2722704 RepID=UPI00168BFF16|nr:hypothetical protein [Flavobacterium selenitireducens]
MAKCLLSVFLIGFLLISCTDEDKRAAEQVKDQKKKEKVFESISESWRFNANPSNSSSEKLIATWPAWRNLLREMSQKPQSSISAFQKKAKILSDRVLELPNNIPSNYNKPQVKARIAVLTTKINSINLFIHLDQIPAEKVIALVNDINVELQGLQTQLDEIDRKSAIPKEQGEGDMIRMLDTARAIPNKGFNPEDVTSGGQQQQPKPTLPKPGSGLFGRDKKIK